MDAQPTGIAVVSHPPPRGLKRPLTSIGRSKAQIDAERAARNRQLHLLAAALNGDNNHVAGIAAAVQDTKRVRLTQLALRKRANCFEYAGRMDLPHGLRPAVGRVKHPRPVTFREECPHRYRRPTSVGDSVWAQQRERIAVPFLQQGPDPV